MNETDLKKQYQHRDRVARAISTDGKFRASCVVNTSMVREAQRRHELNQISTLLLGRAMQAATLLSSFLKGEERVVLETMGNGIIKKIFAEALQVGEVRGYVDINPQPEMPEDALGIGLLRVTKVLYGKFEPVSGMVDLPKGNITTDLAYYLSQSEQIPSAVRLDMNVGEDNIIVSSGGLIVQALPGATEKEIIEVQNSIVELGEITALIESGYTVNEILRQAMPHDIEILSSTPVDFFCRCSLDRFKSIIVTLGIDEVRAMKESQQNELVCQYCNNHYYLSDSDFEEIINLQIAQKN